MNVGKVYLDGWAVCVPREYIGQHIWIVERGKSPVLAISGDGFVVHHIEKVNGKYIDLGDGCVNHRGIIKPNVQYDIYDDCHENANLIGVVTGIYLGIKQPIMNTNYSDMVEISIQFDGAWMAIDSNVKIFIDEIELGRGSFKNGFFFKHSGNKGKHRLKIKVPLRTSTIKFNTRDFNKYVIKLKYNRFTGGWKSESFGVE